MSGSSERGPEFKLQYHQKKKRRRKKERKKEWDLGEFVKSIMLQCSHLIFNVFPGCSYSDLHSQSYEIWE
jgi:hypothetical protein